jgi:hypothetical protein
MIEIVHFDIPNDKDIEKDFFNVYKSIFTFDSEKTKTTVGKQFICRYCGETDRNQFKKGNSHTIPELTGNKCLFSKDECKSCNQLFSVYENELGAHGHLMRTLTGIKSKKGRSPKLKTNLFDLHRDEKGLKMIMKTDLDGINESGDVRSDSWYFDLLKEIDKGSISFPRQKFKPLFLLKCLAKIGLAVMPEREFEEDSFQELKSWLLSPNQKGDLSIHQAYYNIYHLNLSMADRPPILMLFKKQESYKTAPSPTYAMFFSYGSHMFKIFLPYSDSDDWIRNETTIRFPIMSLLVFDKEKRAFGYIDGTEENRVNTGAYKYFSL